MPGASAPTRSFGGKGNFINQLLSYFPQSDSYDVFVDAYGGSGRVLLSKPRTAIEIYNDLDRNVYSLFAVLQDQTRFERFRQRAELTLYDEATSDEYRALLRSDALAVEERAYLYWYVNHTRRGGGLGGFHVSYVKRRGMAKSTADLLASIEGLPALHARLAPVVIRNRDALSLIAEHDHPRQMLYLDPPYVHSTRTAARYNVDADDDHHRALIETLNHVRHAMIALSGYDNPLYAQLQGFQRFEFTVKTVTGSNQRKTKTESLWLNYTPPLTARLFE